MSDPISPLVEAEQAMYAPFFGTMGITFAMIFTAAGSAYGTAKSGTGIASMAVARPDLVMKAIIPGFNFDFFLNQVRKFFVNRIIYQFYVRLETRLFHKI